MTQDPNNPAQNPREPNASLDDPTGQQRLDGMTNPENNRSGERVDDLGDPAANPRADAN